MRQNFLICILLSLTVILCSYDIPEGWYRWGTAEKSYDMGIDKGSGQDGGNAATIKSIKKKIDGFGSLYQNIAPEIYFSKRIRLTGFMKTKDVKDRAGIWMRVDKKNLSTPLAFDNMDDRPVKGTNDWKKYEVVLDVKDSATRIAFGALLVGTGQIWFDKFNIEVVDTTVLTTGLYMKPRNLDFDK